MKSVLIFNGAWRPVVLDTSTPELRDEAFLTLFKLLDDGLNVYKDATAEEFQMLAMARRGNAKYAQALLLVRSERVAERFMEVVVGFDQKERPLETFGPPIRIPCPEALDDRNLPKS